MSDRVSTSFINDGKYSYLGESVVYFTHGREWLRMALGSYCKQLSQHLKDRGNVETLPLDRLEPQTVMIDFIMWLGQQCYTDKRLPAPDYLGKDRKDGESYLHFQVHLPSFKVTRTNL